ncbi:MAG: hypothetical protein KGJ80_16510, partial [Chloroflexota bacterium]|nr:hypothetical protein [Chloroflexota bacterium]
MVLPIAFQECHPERSRGSGNDVELQAPTSSTSQFKEEKSRSQSRQNCGNDVEFQTPTSSTSQFEEEQMSKSNQT